MIQTLVVTKRPTEIDSTIILRGIEAVYEAAIVHAPRAGGISNAIFNHFHAGWAQRHLPLASIHTARNPLFNSTLIGRLFDWPHRSISQFIDCMIDELEKSSE